MELADDLLPLAEVPGPGPGWGRPRRGKGRTLPPLPPFQCRPALARGPPDPPVLPRVSSTARPERRPPARPHLGGHGLRGTGRPWGAATAGSTAQRLPTPHSGRRGDRSRQCKGSPAAPDAPEPPGAAREGSRPGAARRPDLLRTRAAPGARRRAGGLGRDAPGGGGAQALERGGHSWFRPKAPTPQPRRQVMIHLQSHPEQSNFFKASSGFNTTASAVPPDSLPLFVKKGKTNPFALDNPSTWSEKPPPPPPPPHALLRYCLASRRTQSSWTRLPNEGPCVGGLKHPVPKLCKPFPLYFNSVSKVFRHTSRHPSLLTVLLITTGWNLKGILQEYRHGLHN